MILLFGVLWFAVVMAATAVAAQRYWARPATYMDRVGDGLDAAHGARSAESPLFTRLMQSMGEKMPTSPAKAQALHRKLMAAGFRSESAPSVVRGLQLVTAFLAALGWLAAWSAGRFLTFETALGVTLVFAAAGFILPGEVLHLLVGRRRRILRHALPDAIDLMVICVEAGLGLDQALVDVSKELAFSHPALSEELALVTFELRAGKRRAEALKNLADRTGEPEFKNLVGILIQADRFGTSIADALRTHAEFMRVKRRQVAEEKANKVGVKLVFPIFFFILPSMFLVTVGPALLQLLFQFLPEMRQMQ